MKSQKYKAKSQKGHFGFVSREGRGGLRRDRKAVCLDTLSFVYLTTYRSIGRIEEYGDSIRKIASQFHIAHS